MGSRIVQFGFVGNIDADKYLSLLFQDDLQFCITKKAPLLLSQGKVKLIVIDSIAALFRSEYGAKDAVKKAKQLSAIAAQLQQMARLHGASIVCVNQVSHRNSSSNFNRVKYPENEKKAGPWMLSMFLFQTKNFFFSF